MIYLTILIFPVEKKKEETVYVIPTKLKLQPQNNNNTGRNLVLKLRISQSSNDYVEIFYQQLKKFVFKKQV